MCFDNDQARMTAYQSNGERKEDGSVRFLTECCDGDLTLPVEGTDRRFRVEDYSAEAYARIRSEADQWCLTVRYKENWDPSFGYKNRNVDKTSVRDIPDHSIWLKDGAFGGVMMPGTSLKNGNFHLKAVSAEQFDGDPVFICQDDRYGSSDCDMYSETSYYLSKKN